MQVYKSETGRGLVEGFYRRILAEADAGPFESRFLETPAGRTHVLQA